MFLSQNSLWRDINDSVCYVISYDRYQIMKANAVVAESDNILSVSFTAVWFQRDHNYILNKPRCRPITVKLGKDFSTRVINFLGINLTTDTAQFSLVYNSFVLR